MPILANRIKVNTSTTGTGTLTLGSPVDGFYDFAEGGITDGDKVRYVIENGDNFEIGVGVYTASGTTLTRGATESLSGGTPGLGVITLSGDSVVFVTAANVDFFFQTALNLIYGA